MLVRSALLLALAVGCLWHAPDSAAQTGSTAVPRVSAELHPSATPPSLTPAAANRAAFADWTNAATAEALDARFIARAAPSLTRDLLHGAVIGAAVGAAFGLAVIAMADCPNSGCTGERVAGVGGTAVAGAVVGALISGAVHLVRR